MMRALGHAPWWHAPPSEEKEDPEHFALMRGGPFVRLLRAVGLARGDGRDLPRQIVAVVAVTWVPLVVLGLIERIAFGAWPHLLRDPAVHARLLGAIPLLLAAHHVLDFRTGRCVHLLFEDDLAASGSATVRDLLARVARWRDAKGPELLFALAAIGGGQAVLWGFASPSGLVSGGLRTAATSIASVWWTVIALPIGQFMLYRILWRWALWTYFLIALARRGVRANALHPDHCGGLGFLSEPAVGMAFVAASVSAVFAGAWGSRVLFEGANVKAFSPYLGGIAVVSVVVAFGPLCAFARCLQGARLDGVGRYGSLALTYARLFERKWGGASNRERLLGTSDIQSMADIVNVINNVHATRVIPYERRDVVSMLVAVVAPMAPLVLIAMPMSEIVQRVGAVLLGHIPG